MEHKTCNNINVTESRVYGWIYRAIMNEYISHYGWIYLTIMNEYVGLLWGSILSDCIRWLGIITSGEVPVISQHQVPAQILHKVSQGIVEDDIEWLFLQRDGVRWRGKGKIKPAHFEPIVVLQGIVRLPVPSAQGVELLNHTLLFSPKFYFFFILSSPFFPFSSFRRIFFLNKS